MANIIKRVWNQNRMVQIEDLKGMTFQAEQAGHTFEISGIDDAGNTVALTGTPAGVFLRPDNTDVAMTCSVSGGKVSATLPANCYDVPGRFAITIFITSGGSKTAIYAAIGTVSRTSSGTAAPGTTQSVVDLINAINAAINSIPASYSSLLADIAPDYSNSALYSVGQYAWYDGDLKRCIVPITTAESYTAAHWTSAVLGQDVSNLKSAFMQYNGVTDALNINEYEKGSITTTTGENSTYRQNARARTKVVTKAPFDFVLTPFNTSGESTDYYTEVVFYNDDGTWSSYSDKIHEGSTLTITKGQNFRLLIADSNRTASTSVISLEDLVGHIKITSTFGIDFQAMKESLYRNVLHFAYSNKDATTLTANTNIDNLSAGNYLCMSSDVASTLTGLPVAMRKATFRLMVLNAPSSIKLWVIIPRYRSEIYIKKTNGKWIIVGAENQHAFISASSGSDTNTGNSANPFKTIGYALSSGYRKLKVEPGVYNEKISVEGGDIEIIPWVDDQSYSASNAPFRPKIKIIKGTTLTVSETETTGIYQASYTAESGTNIYKVFVDHSVDPTTSGSLALEYNALLVGDMPNTSTSSKAFSPYRQQFYTPVLTETELSAEGTFWYDGTNNLIKFHAWGDTADGEYYVPDDDADTGISLSKMDSVHLEDVKVLGFYDNCININKCDNVTINACEVGYCAKGMGLKLDYCNARVSDCHAYAISVDGYNLHGYGYSEIVNCTAYYCGDDGISHHEGCSGFIDGGEWAYNHSGGITPSFGSQIDVRNVYAHHNGVGINWLGLAAQSRYTRMANCLSVDNTKDIYVIWYVVEAWNNIFRVSDVPYHSARSNLIEYGTVTPT